MNQNDIVRAIFNEVLAANRELKEAFDNESEWAARGRLLAAKRIAGALAVDLSVDEAPLFLHACGVAP